MTNQTTRPRPIFIIGAPRSATSALTWALGQHPNIQPMPETSWIASMGVGGYLSYLKGSERGRFSHLSNVDYPMQPFMARLGESIDSIVHDVFEVRCTRFYGNYREKGHVRGSPKSPNPELQIRRAVDDPKARWIDGTPLNSQFIWILSQMFPEARFLHNLRKPDDVITSLEGFANVGANPQPLAEGVATWFQHTENAWYAEKAFGAERVYRVDFHRVAEEPEQLLRDILAFLGEEYSTDCLLPLRKRLNSSDVDDQRETNRAKLLKINGYREASDLYKHIAATPVADQADSKAEAVLRQRFLDHCHDRPLI